MLATSDLLQEAAQPGLLAAELSRCIDEVPLYRRTVPGLFTKEGRRTPIDLTLLPFITKEDIRRDFPANFLGPETSLDDLLEREVIELEHTSGTSEERTPLLLPRGWWADQERLALNLNATVASAFRKNLAAKRATINSPVCSGDIRYNGVPSRDNRIVGQTLFVSLSRYPFLWSERELDRIAEEILEWEPEFLDVDPVYGVVFALHCERNGIRLPSIRFIVCSYEFVSVLHRSILERAFGVPVFDLYGSTETGHLLMENPAGEMQASLQTAVFELLDLDAQGVADLVVTTLTNPFMPLIRYRIGDLVERLETPYATRYILHGRTADAFQLPSHARVTTRMVDQCFKGLAGIAHYQLIQRGDNGWVLRFVPEGAGREQGQLGEIQERLSQLLQSNTPVEFQKTDMLVPEKSGKFRLGYPSRKT